MKKTIISSLIGGAALLAFSCTQEFSASDVQAQKAAKIKANELGVYEYQTVTVPHQQFSNMAAELRIDAQFDGNNGGFGSFGENLEAGTKVEIKSVTNAKADLGRVLFYDKKLSLNNAIACGSCHFQSMGFADGKQFSEGFEGRITTRNSMSIVNPAMSRAGLFWDTRANCVKNLALQPVQNHIEMGMEDLQLLTKKLAAIDYYPDLFTKAYGSPSITEDRIAEGLNAFVRSFVSWESKYDEGEKTNFGNFTAQEKEGMKLFNDWSGAGCANCHNAPTFDQQWGNGTNIGLDKVSKDKGKGSEQFKVPSLRNVELTAPYMHDGRFKTLEDVVNHYNENVQMNPNLDWNLQNNGKAKKLNLDDNQKKALVAFLKTLTDKKFISDPKFSDPFEKF